MKQKQETQKKKKKTRRVTACEENNYLVGRNKIKRGNGLTENAKILMEHTA